MHEHDRLYIGGEWRAPAGTGVLEVISPSTEEVVGRVPEATTADIDAAVAAARTAFDSGPWARTEPGERAAVLTQLSKLLAGRIDEIAKLISTEAGSPISFSIPAQAFAPTMILDYYANLAATYPFEEVRQGVLGPVVVRREPVGVVAAVIAWNVPLFLTAAKLAPALLAGCTVVLKPAPETPLNAYVFAEACLEAGIPPGVVNVVPAGREVSEYLVRHPGVDKVSFTGSTAAGRTIATICGEQLKRCSLELGGKSAAILLDDVDLAASIPMLVGSGFMNNGEACVAQTRVLAPRGRYAEVVDAVVGAANAMTVGDPLDPATEIGPLITERQRARVESYIVAGSSEGARLVAGGGRPDLAKGWYVEPTVFADVDNGMRIAQEEIFGPVLAVIPYDSEEEALAIANDSDYGLSGTVWSADPAHALDLARQVRTGTMAINHFTLDFAAPFGGFKGSGIGREFGPEGLDQFCELKSISVSPGWTPPGYPAPGA